MLIFFRFLDFRLRCCVSVSLLMMLVSSSCLENSSSSQFTLVLKLQFSGVHFGKTSCKVVCMSFSSYD